MSTYFGKPLPQSVDDASIAAAVPMATETVAGKVELATNAEAITGTSTSLAVTPAGLAAAVGTLVPDASATVAGKANLTAEQQLGTGNKVIGGNLKASNFIGNANTTGAIDVSTAELFARTVTAATTLSFTGAITGRVYSFVLELTNGGAFAVTWPTSVKWDSATAPTLTATGVDILGFYSRDGGVTWRGVVLAKNSA